MKILPVRAQLLHSNLQAHRHDKANSSCQQFCESTLQIHALIMSNMFKFWQKMFAIYLCHSCFCEIIKSVSLLQYIPLFNTGVLISPQPDQEGKKLERQKILIFIYPIYYNWRNISTIYICNQSSIKRNILTIKQNTSGSRSG